MPEITRFLEIIITMYHNDNGHGRPHFHATYGEFSVVVTIDGDVIRGHFPRRKLTTVLSWARRHRQELLDNWARIRAAQPVQRIAGV